MHEMRAAFQGLKTFVSLNSRLERNNNEEEGPNLPLMHEVRAARLRGRVDLVFGFRVQV